MRNLVAVFLLALSSAAVMASADEEPPKRSTLSSNPAPAADTYTMSYGPYGGEKGNKLFQQESDITVHALSEVMHCAKFDSILQVCGQKRREIAEKTNSTLAQDYGTHRERSNQCVAATSLVSYPYMEGKVRDLFVKLFLDPNTSTKQTKDLENVRYARLAKGHFMKVMSALREEYEANTSPRQNFIYTILYEIAQKVQSRLHHFSRDYTKKLTETGVSPLVEDFATPDLNDTYVYLVEVEASFDGVFLPTTSFMAFTKSNKSLYDATFTLIHPAVGMVRTQVASVLEKSYGIKITEKQGTENQKRISKVMQLYSERNPSKIGSFREHKKRCERLFYVARDCSEASNIDQAIAEFFYWSAKTMYFDAGSAACNGWVLRTLYQSKNVHLNLPGETSRLLDEMAQASLTFEEFLPEFLNVIKPRASVKFHELAIAALD